MALFIVGSYKASPYDPDSAFDPVTHVATEAAFIQLLQHGVYDSKYIGYKVQLSQTSGYYNNGLWVITDVNHDSANTGQSNCYDLISEDCFHNGSFGSNQNWRSSTPRTWLNNTFYPGFSTEFKNHILNPKYFSVDTWYTDDKIILPSKVELNGGTASYTDREGVVYPIFTGTAGTGDNTSRIKYQAGTTGAWWTRSRYTRNNSNGVWEVNVNGGMFYDNYSSSYYCLAPLMRVH